MALSDLETEYVGKRGRLFRLASWTGLLTVLTLGIYRFWMKTRLRRYYWSSVRPGGQPLEYVGEPLEKLLGFLIAVVFLAFYIGIVNLLLMFASFSLLNTNIAAYAVSFVGLLPIMFYARFRARRYILARTRWRGVRFGMDQGAWGYAWRALVHWAVTILSLGLLWPRMTFWLEKYRTDLTYFGSQKFVQQGQWKMLFRPALPCLAGMIIVAIGAVVAYLGDEAAGIPVIVIGSLIALYGLVHYNVHSFRLLTNTKTLGGVSFIAKPRPGKVLWIYISGYFLVSFLAVLLAALFGAIFVAVNLAMLPNPDELGFLDLMTGTGGGIFMSSLLWPILYFTVFIMWFALRQIFVVMPLARHYAETLQIVGADKLIGIEQRARDEFEEAEGFADALDLGAAI
ncbi:MAG: YjgN family protein [Marinosulfonomonas sp.]